MLKTAHFANSTKPQPALRFEPWDPPAPKEYAAVPTELEGVIGALASLRTNDVVLEVQKAAEGIGANFCLMAPLDHVQFDKAMGKGTRYWMRFDSPEGNELKKLICVGDLTNAYLTKIGDYAKTLDENGKKRKNQKFEVSLEKAKYSVAMQFDSSLNIHDQLPPNEFLQAAQLLWWTTLEELVSFWATSTLSMFADVTPLDYHTNIRKSIFSSFNDLTRVTFEKRAFASTEYIRDDDERQRYFLTPEGPKANDDGTWVCGDVGAIGGVDTGELHLHRFLGDSNFNVGGQMANGIVEFGPWYNASQSERGTSGRLMPGLRSVGSQ